LASRNIIIKVDLGLGTGQARYRTCDLTAKYVAINADYQTQVDKSSQITTFATIALVLLILLLVFRSLALLIVPLGTIGVALTIANGVVAFLGKHWLTISSETPIFMIVLLAGAGTDYCLFLASRYKEELLAGREPAEAVTETMAHVGEAIASSAAAVMVGMGAMAFAIAHPGVTSAIVGPHTMEQLDDLVAGFDVALSDDILDRIDEIVPPGTDVGTLDQAYLPPALQRSSLRRRPVSERGAT